MKHVFKWLYLFTNNCKKSEKKMWNSCIFVVLMHLQRFLPLETVQFLDIFISIPGQKESECVTRVKSGSFQETPTRVCYIKAFQCLDSFLCFCVTLRTIDPWYQQAGSWSCKDFHFILTQYKKNNSSKNLPMILCHGRLWKAVKVWPRWFGFDSLGSLCYE